jgi:hypothetical protein
MRGFSLDVLREFIFINFVRAIAMHLIVDTNRPMGWLLGLASYRLNPPREVEGFHSRFGFGLFSLEIATSKS